MEPACDRGSLDDRDGSTDGGVPSTTMPRARVSVSLDPSAIAELDRLAKRRRLNGRSQALRAFVEAGVGRLDARRFARECAKLDPEYEKALAEWKTSRVLEQWPES